MNNSKDCPPPKIISLAICTASDVSKILLVKRRIIQLVHNSINHFTKPLYDAIGGAWHKKWFGSNDLKEQMFHFYRKSTTRLMKVSIDHPPSKWKLAAMIGRRVNLQKRTEKMHFNNTALRLLKREVLWRNNRENRSLSSPLAPREPIGIPIRAFLCSAKQPLNFSRLLLQFFSAL